MFLTEEDEFDANTTTHCVHCGVRLTWDLTCNSRAVKHHNHCKQTVFKTDSNGKRTLKEGNYVATICNACNLVLTNKRVRMNVMLHNGGGYDIHNFLFDVELLKGESCFILPKQSTKYYTIKIGRLAFVDTLNYFPFSLSKLADSLTGEMDKWSCQLLE